MIFIKDKKAWKEFVKENDMKPYAKPDKFPCYQFYSVDYGEQGVITTSCNYLYLEDLKSMADKIEKGREF